MVITKRLSHIKKYLVKLPYQFPQYGTLYGFVYAEDEEEAEDLEQDRCNLHDEDYNDKDSGDSEYFYDELEIELEESGVTLFLWKIKCCYQARMISAFSIFLIHEHFKVEYPSFQNFF